jgi:hypothetical protein
MFRWAAAEELIEAKISQIKMAMENIFHNAQIEMKWRKDAALKANMSAG